MKITTKLLPLFTLLFTLSFFTGCKAPVSTQERINNWTSSFPLGFQKQIEVARAAEYVYHTIADTPMVNLQTEEGSRELGLLVTMARDKYRQWQSYGGYYVPQRSRYGLLGGVRFGDGIIYEPGQKGKSGNPIRFIFGHTTDGSKPTIQGYIQSSRGRAIFGGRWNEERNWVLNSPFREILQGDRIANIPNLIARIKR
ncbi:hypothetical protein HN604_01635 [archaeon]|jgi:hypothetical protein|nr:hypothetical protein [archaeon]MBT7251400.1 hypothetical protein [archaeon]MBT7660764.1 hypothetical protein [archaeon]